MSEQQISAMVHTPPTVKRAGVAPGWIAGALVAGLVVGAAATWGVMTFFPSLTGAQPVPMAESALAASAWFGEDEQLPSSVTEPGTQLTLGDPATVLIGGEAQARSVASITVTTIAALSSEDEAFLKSVQPALAGQRLYRVEYSVQYQSGDPLAGVRVGDALAPVDAEGAELLRVPVSGWKSCGDAVLPAEVDLIAEGESEPTAVLMCAVAASPEGAADVAGARFSQPGGPYSVAAKGQLTWLP